jgi:NOL1/NOP2/sun family putative RNA methylase
MKLPVEFLNKMNALLGDEEYKEFIKSYNKLRYFGLRVNTLKISVEEFLKISPFRLESVPWTRDGFYYPEGESPGKHPYYHAGLYYIQEPSAMLPGEVIDARPGERILDLCAAPGGKTVQIAAGMKGEGILVANDINSDRVKALVKNIELCGVKNAVVTNDSPEKLARNFEGYFDKILVDAPCSGEGMFRKDDDAARSWENFKCDTCAGMQRDILATVDNMLKPGGCIVYSTCTFSPEEDEKMIVEFMERHKGYELIETPKTGGIESGRPTWANGDPALEKTARLWPHRLRGEGHFVAKLRKNIEGGQGKVTAYAQRKTERVFELEAFYSFVKGNLNTNIEGHFEVKGNNLYNLPEPPPDLNGIKVAKFGWYLGEFTRERFEPSHSLATALKKDDIINALDFSSQSSDVLRYLKGETLILEGKKGYTAVCVDGHTLGWGKQTGDMLKNLYPKGWRKMG